MITPKESSEITVEWLTEALLSKGWEDRPTSIEVDSHFGEVSQLGEVSRVILKYKEGASHSVIVKFQTAASDKLIEIKNYRLLSEDNTLSVPRLLGEFGEGGLIIEDLSPGKAHSEMSYCPIPMAEKILDAISKIHTKYWGDKRVSETAPEKFAGVIQYRMEQSLDDFLNRYSSQLGDAKEDFIWLAANSHIISEHRLGKPSTLFHGDLHLANIISYENGGQPKIIDWQLACRGLAANDVSFFLIKSLTVEQREKYENDLLRKYYNSLTNRIKDQYSREWFLLDYRATITRSMISAVMLVGPLFENRANQFKLADFVAERVISAVKVHKPVEAFYQIKQSSYNL